MYVLSFAGVVFNRDYFEAVKQLVDTDNPELVVVQPAPGKAVASIFGRSGDSSLISEVITQLTTNKIPHRIITIPYYSTRVMESVLDDGTSLVIHHKACDTKYQVDWYGEDRRVLYSPMHTGVDVSEKIESIVVVGPHYEARKVYRWMDFNMREKTLVQYHTILGAFDRLDKCKLYIKVDSGYWYVIHSQGVYICMSEHNFSNECIIAKINGFEQHVVTIAPEIE